MNLPIKWQIVLAPSFAHHRSVMTQGSEYLQKPKIIKHKISLSHQGTLKAYDKNAK